MQLSSSVRMNLFLAGESGR